MNKGEIAWQIPNGDTPPSVKNNPALKGLTIPKTGSPSQAGVMVTKTLVFAGEGAGGLAVFHAYDKATGEEIWQTPLPGPQVSLPMTYCTTAVSSSSSARVVQRRRARSSSRLRSRHQTRAAVDAADVAVGRRRGRLRRTRCRSGFSGLVSCKMQKSKCK
jgi:outer membrane protein assembly factor BamB